MVDNMRGGLLKESIKRQRIVAQTWGALVGFALFGAGLGTISH